MKFKFIVATLTLILGLNGLTAGLNTVTAESMQDKLNENQEKQSQNAQEKKQKQNEIEKVKQQQEKVDQQIETLDKKVMETTSNIKTKESEVKETRANIQELKKEIAELKKRIAERDELLKDRARSIYQNGGGIEYLDVLMGAESFGNFLERVMSLNTIAEQDKNILEEHKADKKAVEQKKSEVETQLKSLEEKLAELESLKQQLDQQKAEKQELMSSLEMKEEELHKHVMNLEETNENLRAQEAAMEKEIERQKERARQRAAERAANSNNNSSSSASQAPVPSGNSNFIWPADGYVTSNWGQRWGRLHSGIDIARSGSVPIYAAAAGTVIRAYYSQSYGNVVLIAHQIDGKTYTTLYAHMRSTPLVSSGQSVSAGTRLGTMGNTGNSTGQHLHFEIHIGSWNPSRSNSVAPSNYLP